MSIVMVGSTSGSITLQEPAIAGSNTISLPAATGTAVLTGVSGTVDINAAGSNNVTLSTNSSERMRIDSSGNLLVGTTSQISSCRVSVFSPDLSLTAGGIAIRNGATNLNGNWMSFVNASNNSAGAITQTGTTTTSYNTSSDYRMKENIAPMVGALERVSQLKPCTYSWKHEFGGEQGQGFIAHELAEVCPDAVVGEKDAVDAEGNPIYQGIDTSFLVATLTAAIQELKGIVDTQATKIAELEAKLEGTA